MDIDLWYINSGALSQFDINCQFTQFYLVVVERSPISAWDRRQPGSFFGKMFAGPGSRLVGMAYGCQAHLGPWPCPCIGMAGPMSGLGPFWVAFTGLNLPHLILIDAKFALSVRQLMVSCAKLHEFVLLDLNECKVKRGKRNHFESFWSSANLLNYLPLRCPRKLQISKWGIPPHGIFGSWAWGSRGFTKWGEFLGRRRRRRRHLEIQVDILAGELYLEFVLMELGPGGSSWRFGTGVLHRIAIPFIWAEWFGLGSHFWKNHKISRILTFSKMGMTNTSRNVNV